MWALLKCSLGLVCLILAHTSAAQTCQHNSMPDQPTDLLKSLREGFEQSPFLVACRSPGLLKNRPSTGLLVRSVPEKDARGRATKIFLKRVLARVQARVDAAENQIANLKTCMAETSPRCSELNNWVDKELPDYVKNARFHLSLAQSEHELRSWFGRGGEDANSGLNSLGSYKYESWAPLDNAEAGRAEAQLKKYKELAEAEIPNAVKEKQICKYAPCKRRFVSESLLVVRHQHFMAYQDMMGELPLMQYLKGPQVSRLDVQAAFEPMGKNLKAEGEMLEKYRRMLDSNKPLPTDVLDLMDYNSAVEEVLLEDDRDCGLASSLVFTKGNRQLGTGLAIGLPILAASMFAPPLAGLALGAVTGTAVAVSSHMDLKSTERRSLGFIYGDSLHTDLAHLSSDEKARNYSLVTLPVGMGLGGMMARGLSVSAKSFVAGRTMFKASAAVQN